MKKLSAIVLAACFGAASFSVMAADDMAKSDAGTTSAPTATKSGTTHKMTRAQKNHGSDAMTKDKTYESGK